MGLVLEGILGAVAAVIAFIIIRSLVDGLDTSTWGTAEVTMLSTILPLVTAVVAVVVVLGSLRKISGN